VVSFHALLSLSLRVRARRRRQGGGGSGGAGKGRARWWLRTGKEVARWWLRRPRGERAARGGMRPTGLGEREEVRDDLDTWSPPAREREEERESRGLGRLLGREGEGEEIFFFLL